MLAVPRRAARVILVDHAYRVLLLHATDPARPERGTWWELPGGGLRRGEDSAAACLRELREETGYDAGVRVGPCVWTRTFPFVSRTVPVRQHERIHVAWLDDPSAPRAGTAMSRRERQWVLGERWWTLDELAESDGTFYPRDLPRLAPVVVRGDYGPEPVEVE